MKKKKTAVTKSEIKPVIRSIILAQESHWAISRTLNTLTITRKAEFNKVADKSAEMGEGASECASGSQKCTGARPIFVPKPKSINTKDNLSQKGSKSAAFLYSCAKSRVFISPCAMFKNIIPTKASAIPIEQINTYFHAASIECFVLLKYIRYALESVVASTKIHAIPRLLDKIVPVIASTKTIIINE